METLKYTAQDLQITVKKYRSSMIISVNHEGELLYLLTLENDNFSDFTESENWEGLRESIDCDEIFAALAENYPVCKWITEKSAK